MERERVVSCGRVAVAAPGVVRGFDAMEVKAHGRWWALISADAAVLYRTSVHVTASYDGRSVAEAVERDFRQHGAPLVWRVDRARSHETDEVFEVLDRMECSCSMDRRITLATTASSSGRTASIAPGSITCRPSIARSSTACCRSCSTH